MHIESIPMWTGKGNNYAYLISDEPTKDAVIVDPANPPDHWDHAGGNDGIASLPFWCNIKLTNSDCGYQLQQFGNLDVIGGKDCKMVTKTPAHGEKFKIGDRITVTALHTPCHTQDSICYFAEDGNQRVVFTGDTLFIAGCGRFFEGNAQEMHRALNEVLATLPDDTKVYPGHEYTKSNVKFCLSVSQSEPIQKLQAYCENNSRTELHNVFMRVTDPEMQKATGMTSPVDVMNALREMKNAA
ncbi:hydroxyacylglutathione hydrolase [Coccidioides immitis RMSCC 3703]|uniref:hydroxyacylglutathione hydrolase n=1 Tax=Coccidioides immitis RMSCC 3703 TaxID=454286 RepID=A0A0J8RAZ2_COCIT|nr:hydroxyacylglutathione hydrolase [Coccidioides immitis RMSCC 3703]